MTNKINQIFIASSNPHKIKEIQAIISPGIKEIYSPQNTSYQLEVEETGATFKENAFLKAQAYHQLTGYPTLADDSGLTIPAFQNKPGVYSNRMYPGNSQQKCQKLLQDLKEAQLAQPKAYFICVMALILPTQETFSFTGKLKGEITSAPTGEQGFGFDPVFYLPGKNKTVAQLSSSEKNKISHRAQALKKLQAFVKKKLLI